MAQSLTTFGGEDKSEKGRRERLASPKSAIKDKQTKLSALTFDGVDLVVGKLLASSNLSRDGADAGNLQSTVGVRVKLRHSNAQLTARVDHSIPHHFHAVDGRLHRSLVQMPPDFVERAQSISKA